jgi:hypothetical protein
LYFAPMAVRAAASSVSVRVQDAASEASQSSWRRVSVRGDAESVARGVAGFSAAAARCATSGRNDSSGEGGRDGSAEGRVRVSSPGWEAVSTV